MVIRCTTVNSSAPFIVQIDMRECFYMGLMTADERERAGNLPAVRSSTFPRGSALPNPEIRAMFLCCLADHRPEGMRDAALFAALYSAGLRRAEVVSLALADYTPESGALTVRQGKGRKDRVTRTSLIWSETARRKS